MAITGLGQDGYVRIQKESSYGVAVYSDMTFLPAKAGSSFVSKIEKIENSNIVSSRLKQLPNNGREVSTFEIQMSIYPDLVGTLINMLLGASDDGTVTDGTYTHTWLMPNSGNIVGNSFTMEVAKGGDTATRYAGCVINMLKIASDTQNNITLTISGVAQSAVDGITRATVFTYPVSTPMNFGMLKVSLTPSGGSLFVQPCNSVDIEIDLGYNIEDFKTGSTKIVRPMFSKIPSIKLKAGIDAEKKFYDSAKSGELYKIYVSIESVAYASGTTTFKQEIEIPKAQLSADTDIPYDNDRLTMDLDFECGFGGTTTGSPSIPVMAEVRVRDTEATYA